MKSLFTDYQFRFQLLQRVGIESEYPANFYVSMIRIVGSISSQHTIRDNDKIIFRCTFHKWNQYSNIPISSSYFGIACVIKDLSKIEVSSQPFDSTRSIALFGKISTPDRNREGVWCDGKFVYV